MSAQPDAWNPDQYERFRAERTAPFFDLLGMLEARPGMRVLDLGCGTGELTAQLCRRLAARTIGIDSSPNMLAKAAKFAHADLSFQIGDIETFDVGDDIDLVFSNAAIQWVPDHRALLAKWSKRLHPGAQVAIQMPANDDHVTHEAARIVARREPFCAALKSWVRPVAVLPPEQYASILYDSGFAEQKVRVFVYPHVLDDRQAVIEWVKGTLLTDYQRRLSPDLWEGFLGAYQKELFAAIPDARPYFYPFKRILIWAKR